jgi:hypothetical protein
VTVGRYIVCDWCDKKQAIGPTGSFTRGSAPGWLMRCPEPEGKPKDFCSPMCAGTYEKWGDRVTEPSGVPPRDPDDSLGVLEVTLDGESLGYLQRRKKRKKK